MSPWWLRPTSEGAANEENEPQKDLNPKPPAAGKESAAPGAEAPAAQAPASAAASSTNLAGDAHGALGAGDADKTGVRSWSDAPADSSPLHPSSTTTTQAPPEPYRPFWQRPAPPAAATPATLPTPPNEVPASTSHHGASPAAAWSGAADSASGWTAADSATEPPAVNPMTSLTPLAPPIPVVPPAALSSHTQDDHATAGADSSAAPASPAFAASSQTLGDAADLDAEGDEGEGETEERDEEGKPAGAKKKRSRRSRGGRRKNGRTALAGGPADLADEDDEDLAPLALEEALAVAAPPPPAPAQIFPSVRPARSGESYVISGGDLDSMTREIIISVPDRQRPQHEERKIAVFCDFENIALGVRDSEISKLDINLILERLLEKGKIIVKKAYADWERYSDYKRPFHEAAIELIDIPQKYYSGKNSADIKMVVDAMDLSYAKEHLDTFVILSGDSDFSPLVSKLKENNKYVIGIGVKNSSSNLLVDNCDEFIYYEDIWRDSQKGPKLDGLSKKTAEAFSLMVESIQALVRENKDVLWGSMIKQTMQRKKPSFNEGYYGYSTFSELLEDAERKSIVKLKKDQRSGTYIVTGFAKTSDVGAAGSGRRQG